MSSRGPYRRHNPQFKPQLCTDIRSDKIFASRDAEGQLVGLVGLLRQNLDEHSRTCLALHVTRQVRSSDVIGGAHRSDDLPGNLIQVD